MYALLHVCKKLFYNIEILLTPSPKQWNNFFLELEDLAIERLKFYYGGTL
jgi:hypothetical protein